MFSFIKAYPDAQPIVRADKTALGTIPAKALQYCEALRSASSFGWYAYPAATSTLLFDGKDIYINIDSAWELLNTEHASDPDEWWNKECPEYLIDKAPPFITSIGVAGYVQIWSGHLVRSAGDWSVLIRPVANTTISNQYFCFEGIVETDQYRYAPLFTNIKILKTDIPITINAHEPLFQVQPVHRSSYSSEVLQSFSVSSLDNMAPNDWTDYSSTIRSNSVHDTEHKTGSYAVDVRKRSKE